MYKHLFTIFLVSLLMIQALIPINEAAAVDGLSINATVNGTQSLEIGDDGKVTTTVNFNLLPEGTATSNERKPMDVVIVFDKSGSMAEEVSGSNSKLALAKEAVQKAVDTFKVNSKNSADRYGLVSFDSGVNSNYTITTLQSDPNRITDKIKYVPAKGGTNYTDALKIARNILLNSTNRSTRDQYIIFMTDGKPTNSMKSEYVNGNYYKLIESNDYYNMYGYWAYYNKYYNGQQVSVGETSYIISDSRATINGTKTVYYDSNGDRNVKVIEHNNALYFHSKYNSAVPNDIKDHAREQAQNIANSDITLLSIGFGDQSQLDMNLLTELSSKSNGKAERATGDNIVKIFNDISDNISAEYPSLSNGFIRFVLPSGVTVQQNDQVTIIKEMVDGKNQDVVYMNLRDIKFNPRPPQAGDQSLQYDLPLIFTSPGQYNFSFDVLYNSGKVSKRGLKYDVNVVVPLKKIDFRQKTKTILLGERIKVEDYLSFTPLNATNKTIKEVLNIGDTSPISIEKVNGEWYVTGENIGYTQIRAVADYKYPTITDEMTIVTKKKDSSTGETDPETNPEDGGESEDGSDSYGKW
ncbi:vWA domain-containing protein [Metabacillus litoralis]|uniref:vWA domain-containing protein n=1 Tax=Metabacillus litoralis TaxID=152268 RepID=UPI001CFCAB80|nr:vWA domain-containing protein [Metabacillus litoralis]